MSYSINYTLKLVADAEPSSGFGTELINGLVPRGINGLPVIPASHIKGLMRQAIIDFESAMEDTDDKALLEVIRNNKENVFGKKGNNAAIFSLTDCIPTDIPSVKTVTRTALNSFGIAKDSTLRTTETIAADTEFKGRINFIKEPTQLENLLVRYALLSIMEVGGSRNRGCGACFIAIEGEKQTLPGDILKTCIEEIKKGNQKKPLPPPMHPQGDPKKMVTLKLRFIADGPICVPELPVVAGNNIIRTGFAIPASAVQGIILHRIDALNHAVASACFKSDIFRVWPLLPTTDDTIGIPARTSATHKIKKVPIENDPYQCRDEIIEKYTTTENLPFKSADGVLFRTKENVKLWRSADMARHITAHGVHNGDAQTRNLFTVESLAVNKFCGLVAMPEDAALILLKSLKDDPNIFVGKSRSIRGRGTLSPELLEIFPDFEYPIAAQKVSCYIVQTPLLIEGVINGESVDIILKDNVEKAGWGKVVEATGSMQVLFGWNRHKNGLQKAERVIAPGSVFKLEIKPENLQELLVKGIGKGKERGYGAVLPHPGIAKERYTPKASPVSIKSPDQSGKIGWDLWKKASDTGLTPSQIAQVQSELANGKQAAIDFLDRQQNDGPAKIWDRWKPVIEVVRNEISNNPDQAGKALKVWHDLAVYNESKGGRL